MSEGIDYDEYRDILRYNSSRAISHFSEFLDMADKSVATSVDVLSAVERKAVVDALAVKIASVKRASRAATNAAVTVALRNEAEDLERLALKFS